MEKARIANTDQVSAHYVIILTDAELDALSALAATAHAVHAAGTTTLTDTELEVINQIAGMQAK